jgi:hypothetical protein
MIISNITGITIDYSVKDTSSTFDDGGTINAGSYVEFQPRGTAPFTVSWVSNSIILVSVPSPAIVTFWRGTNESSGGFSQ